jgi:2-dehydropantoate 2-reductase
MSEPRASLVTAEPVAQQQRVLVVGCGGIGGITAACLTETWSGLGVEVVGYSTNAAIADAIQRHGYRLTGAEAARAVPGHCVTALTDAVAPFDLVILAVQPPQVEEAARAALPWLKPDGAMVCLQNGLCEDRVAKIVGADRALGAVVAWGASMPEPGLFERTASGGFAVGRMDAAADPRVDRLAVLLECVGPVTRSENFAGARWSKLAINAAISTMGTIGGDRLGALMVSLTVRRLVLAIMTETVRVARASGIKLEKVSGTLDLDWIALTDEEARVAGSPSLVAKHTLLLAVGARYRRMRSSMLSAIERGRPPAVDFLNGEVVDRGRALGIPTPVNEASRAMVWTIARRERASGMSSIYALAESLGLR